MQLQHDYLLGNYPVGRDDAAQLCALQILVGIGFVNSPESCMLVFLSSAIDFILVVRYFIFPIFLP